MAFCNNCGQEQANPEAKFCNNCGHKIIKPEETGTSYTQNSYGNNDSNSYNSNYNNSNYNNTNYNYQSGYNGSFARSAYTDNYNSYAPRSTYTSTQSYGSNVSVGSSVVSMVFGILAANLSVLCYIPFIFFFFTGMNIAFICISFARRNAYLSQAYVDNGFSKAGKICSIVAIPLTAFFTFIGLMITVTI